MLILITNDDGIQSPALHPLKVALDTIADTIIFAPDRNWSASGHPKTLQTIMRAEPITWQDGSLAYKSTAAPPDCVALAILGVVEKCPDLVVSGINLGANLGYDIFYSGTVAAVLESIFHDVHSLAFSKVDWSPDDDLTHHGKFSAQVAKCVLENGLPPRTFLNINFPACSWSEIEGVCITTLGNRVFYDDRLICRQDPNGHDYFWFAGTPHVGTLQEGTDAWAVRNNLISITPISLHMTAHDLFEPLKKWQLEDLWQKIQV
ncbi:MAG: 5'/3'-nucleotidase SurE [Anaerolineaceae bacterium 4572_78]|nr:MAG: 5'/3'-nucleotidase SurE [Anaerolineaceae bacterium 4572_78]